MAALFLAIGTDDYVAVDMIARFERREDGTGLLHMKDGTVLPLLPAEVDPVHAIIRQWCYETGQPQMAYEWRG